MPKYPIIGPGYQGRSSNVNASRCINLYPEINGQDSKSAVSLVGTPGLLLYIDTLLGPIRGTHFFNNKIYFVSGNKLYSVDNAKNLMPVLDASTDLQVSLTASEGRVFMADNGMYSVDGAVANQLAFVDGQNVYVVNVTTGAFNSYAYPATTIEFIGGYFMINMGGARFGVSALYDGTSWNPLSVSTADAYPDNLLAVSNNHNEAWLFGESSVEVWMQDGSANFLPFSRTAVLDYGIAAYASLAKGSNTLFWLVAQRNGNSGELLGVAMANGYGVDIISPQAINDQISRYPVVSDAFGYCYTERGHEFYVLTFPTANATWVYDATTKLWHERSYYSGSPYAIGRHIGNSYAYAWGRHYVGSYLDGKIYEMSENYLDDDGAPIASVRVCAPLEDKNNNQNVFISRLQLDAETGNSDDVMIIDPSVPIPPFNLTFMASGHSYVSGTYSGLGTSGNSYRREMYYRARTKWGMPWNFVGAQDTGGDFPTPKHEGVAGTDSTTMAGAMPTYLARNYPAPSENSCVIMGPIEFADCLNSVPLATFKSNIAGMINTITAYSTLIKIFVLTGPDTPNYTGFPPGQHINDYAAKAREAYNEAKAAGKNVYLVDCNSQAIHIPRPGDPAGGDDIHPDWLGFEQMGDYICDQIASLMGVSLGGTDAVQLLCHFNGYNRLADYVPDTNNTGSNFIDYNNRFKCVGDTLMGVGGYAFDTYKELGQVAWVGSIKYFSSVTGTTFFLLKANSTMTSYLYLWLDTAAQLLRIGSESGAYGYDNAPFACSNSTWYTFDIVISGNSITISNNGVQIIKTPLLTYANQTRIGFSYFDSGGNVSLFDELLIYQMVASATRVYAVKPNVALLSWSSDGGHTWSNDHEAVLGKRGEYSRRATWRRVGAARNRTIRIACSESMKKVWSGFYMESSGG